MAVTLSQFLAPPLTEQPTQALGLQVVPGAQ